MSGNVVLEEFRLRAKAVGISLAPRVEAAVRAVRRVGRSLLALLVIVRVGQIHPEAAVILEDAPHFVEHKEQVADEIVRVIFMPELALPAVRPF